MGIASVSTDGSQPAGQTVRAPEAGALDEQAIGISETTQEVRVAVAMSGGVSLAVWMGGVAREINLLQQASNERQYENTPGADGAAPGQVPGPGARDWDGRARELYLRLLRCLDLTVTVDVLAGTSAGGVNAALLGLSSAAGADLAGLRNLWLTTGSMDQLLRDPGEKNPPSLLQGDKVLFTQLARGIEDLSSRPRAKWLAPAGSPGQPVDTTVFITTTMMSAETSQFTDDYGTVVPDVDHHGLFTFHQEDLAPGNGDPPELAALALAARCSASFPGAFEPSYVPIGSTIAGVPGVPLRPDMTRFANMTRSHWVADGGLLDNRPLSPLLSTVLGRRATREVRRVLAFVVPDGGAPSGPLPTAQWAKPPTMAGALKTDLDAQLSQSIAGELQLIRAHNDQLNSTDDLRRSLAEMGARLQPGSLVTPRLLADYQVQQGRGLARPLGDALMREVSALRPLPAAWVATLSPARPAASGPPQAQLEARMTSILGGGWRGDPGDGPLGDDASWAAWTSAPDPVTRASWFGLPAFRAAQATVLHLIRLGYRQADDHTERQVLARHHAAVTAAAGNLPPAGGAGANLAGLAKQAVAPPVDRPRPSLPQVAADLATVQRLTLLIGPDISGALQDAWEDLAAAAITLLGDLGPLARARAVPDGREPRRDAARTMTAYLDYLGDTADPAVLADRLLNLTIAERALQPADPGIDQPVEFIQVSANTRTKLAPEHTAGKLRGMELHHFAAFYKSSWRAYDWMWGRLDGSGWLVHILLDPRRILAVIEDQYPWGHGERARGFAGLLRQITGLPEGLDGDCLEADLAFLDDPEAEIPVSLPGSALFLARAWQELITANELPVIADRMVADDQRPAAPDPWVTTVRDLQKTSGAPREFAARLPSCPVRWQSLAGEEHTPAFLQLATKAAAVATAALTAAPEAPRAIRPILTSARNVTWTGYRATKAFGGNSRTTLLAGVALAIVGIVLASAGTVVIGLPGTVVALVGLYLIALGAWGIGRGLLGALAGFTALLAVGALALRWVRTELWGRNGSARDGLIPSHVLPWLRDSWWAGLVLLGGVIMLAVLVSVLPRGRAPRNPGKEQPAGGDAAPGTPSPAGDSSRDTPSPAEPAPDLQPQAMTAR